MRPFVVGLILVLPAGICGCGGGGGERLHGVTGKVTFKDGKPVTEGLVVFDAGEKKTGARGEIQKDGTFRLGTHTLTDGAAEGQYRVLVVPPPIDEEAKVRRPTIHTKYSTPETTPIKLTVSRDASKNNFKIEVERP